jgi:hypothetical protein
LLYIQRFFFCYNKKFGPFLDLCVSSLRSGHANFLCIVPILLDVPEGTKKEKKEIVIYSEMKMTICFKKMVCLKIIYPVEKHGLPTIQHHHQLNKISFLLINYQITRNLPFFSFIYYTTNNSYLLCWLNCIFGPLTI